MCGSVWNEWRDEGHQLLHPTQAAFRDVFYCHLGTVCKGVNNMKVDVVIALKFKCR